MIQSYLAFSRPLFAQDLSYSMKTRVVVYIKTTPKQIPMVFTSWISVTQLVDFVRSGGEVLELELVLVLVVEEDIPMGSSMLC